MMKPQASFRGSGSRPLAGRHGGEQARRLQVSSWLAGRHWLPP